MQSSLRLVVFVSCVEALLVTRVHAQATAPRVREPAVLFVGPQTRSLPPRIREREQTLRIDLAALRAGTEQHVVNGAVQTGIGAAFITTGVFLRGEFARSLMFVLGAGTLAHGLVQLLLVEDATTAAQSYAELPMFTADQVRARIRFGEQSLARLARGGRRARIVDGVVTMVVASSYVPIVWAFQRRDDPSYRFGDSASDYVGVTLSAINFVTGLVTALVRSEAERRYDRYRDMHARFERVAPGELEQLAKAVSLQMAASAGRMHLGANIRF